MAQNSIPDVLLGAATRSELPYILFPDDIALRLRLDAETARRAIREGLLGPSFYVRGEPAVLRDHFKEHLRLLMVQRREGDRELLPNASAAPAFHVLRDEEGGAQ